MGGTPVDGLFHGKKNTYPWMIWGRLHCRKPMEVEAFFLIFLYFFGDIKGITISWEYQPFHGNIMGSPTISWEYPWEDRTIRVVNNSTGPPPRCERPCGIKDTRLSGVVHPCSRMVV